MAPYILLKCGLSATCWHCQTPESFQRELLMHMNQQEYRRKSRGLEKPRRGRKLKYQEASPVPMPETRNDVKGQVILLS